MRSALYPGRVTHARFRPRRHRLSYRIFQVLIDLDELPTLDGRLRLFSHNRPNLIAFHDKDHGDRTGGPLRPWAEARLRAAGLAPDGGPIRILTMPRVLNHVFNPISVWFCHTRDGAPLARIYEVNNTFGQTHSYVLPEGRDRCEKALYVSPLMDMELTYDFDIEAPGAGVKVGVSASDAEGALLAAVFAGRRVEMTDGTLARAWLEHPLLSLKVLAGIHWEALRTWVKGVRYVPQEPPRLVITAGKPR